MSRMLDNKSLRVQLLKNDEVMVMEISLLNLEKFYYQKMEV